GGGRGTPPRRRWPSARRHPTGLEGGLAAPSDTGWLQGPARAAKRTTGGHDRERNAMQPTPEKRRSTGMIVGGVIAAFVAALALAAGGTSIWADATQRDDAGYVSTHTHHYASGSRAI